MTKINESFEDNVKNFNGDLRVGYKPNYPADADKVFGAGQWGFFKGKFDVTVNIGSHWLSNTGSSFDSYIIFIRQQYDYIEYFHKDYPGFGRIRGEVSNFKSTLVSIRPPPKCRGGTRPPPTPIPFFFPGNASPPPPPHRKMCGCDCNTIASIIAEQMAEKQRLLDAIKQHIDSRAVEQLELVNKMLQDMEMNVDLQPVIDELKRVEQTLWNGISGG
ncbi:hypothetical protein [Microcoleus sp. CAWBG58]|uniref:hypothetical protein n=1 Tax=Microcoleus sp. CAWBG58 TaxID=2841651 RepID=UPI0025DDBC2B|nr:hypothetical protein [Microcoleus sp. CAWBG58]